MLKNNGPETNYFRQVMQHNPNLRERFSTNTKQENNKQVPKETKNTVKENAEAFSAITGQEISEEEVS